MVASVKPKTTRWRSAAEEGEDQHQPRRAAGPGGARAFLMRPPGLGLVAPEEGEWDEEQQNHHHRDGRRHRPVVVGEELSWSTPIISVSGPPSSSGMTYLPTQGMNTSASEPATIPGFESGTVTSNACRCGRLRRVSSAGWSRRRRERRRAAGP